VTSVLVQEIATKKGRFPKEKATDGVALRGESGNAEGRRVEFWDQNGVKAKHSSRKENEKTPWRRKECFTNKQCWPKPVLEGKIRKKSGAWSKLSKKRGGLLRLMGSTERGGDRKTAEMGDNETSVKAKSECLPLMGGDTTRRWRA